ncbi:MAG: MFS transporter [Actinomyces sp.]|nr:MAG: MFS transporter [Actinomyces sp.]
MTVPGTVRTPVRVPRSIHAGLFALTASIGMIFALVARLQDEHGFATSALGVIAAAAFFAAVVAQLALAPLADRGHARALMVGALLAGAGAATWLAVATEAWQFVGGRALSGLAYGAYAPAARAVVAAADPARAGRRLGTLAGVETAGFITGPGLAGLLVDRIGVDAPFVGAAVVAVALVWPLLRLPPGGGADHPVPGAAVVAAPRGARALLARREVVAATCLAAAFQLPAGLYEAIWARFMDDLGASTLFIGVSLTFYGIPFALTAPVAGRLSDRYGPYRVLPVALAVVVPLTVVYGWLTVPLTLMALASVEAVANGAAIPAAQAAMARATGPGEAATGQGLAAAAGQVAAGLAALVAAPVYERVGPEATFAVVAAGVTLLAAVGFALARRPRGAVEPAVT